MIPSVVFMLAVALQTKFSLSSKFFINLGSVPKASTDVLLTSKKHMTGFLVKIFGEYCKSTVLAVTCY